jgi:hypothetical protein
MFVLVAIGATRDYLFQSKIGVNLSRLEDAQQ